MIPLPRHRLTAAVATLLLAGLMTACDGRKDSAATVQPATVDAGTTCSLDGMVLADYPGPKAQIHYEGQALPDFFCDTTEMFNTWLHQEQARRITAIYVQDMGKTSWDQPEDHWIDAKTAFYVVGSKRLGSMGPTIGAFGSEADARKFASENGGTVLPFDKVTAAQATLDGGALHDHQM